MSLVIRILHCYFIVYYYTGSSSVNWLAVSCIYSPQYCEIWVLSASHAHNSCAWLLIILSCGSSSVNWLAVSCILTAILWDMGFKCKSCTQVMCLIINHFVMYYSNLQVNYMVTVVIRWLLLFILYHLLSCSKCFVCLCLFQYRHCFLVGWCTNKSYVIATSDLWLFIHASNLLPSTPHPHSLTYWFWCPFLFFGGGDSSVVRAPDSWLKSRGFESLLERRDNFLLQGRLSVLTLISVSVPPPCYRSST